MRFSGGAPFGLDKSFPPFPRWLKSPHSVVARITVLSYLVISLAVRKITLNEIFSRPGRKNIFNMEKRGISRNFDMILLPEKLSILPVVACDTARVKFVKRDEVENIGRG